MEKTFQPALIESHWRNFWEKSGFFKPRTDTSGQPYCIMIPPPNVTGSLHMGHAFQDTIMDTLVRYHRMLGEKTLWQVGTDHAGIATQMVVERQLAQENLTRQQLGREAFVERIWDWKQKSGGAITAQLRRLGASVDWDRERFTMDEGLSNAVNEVFVRLYEDGLIYRGKRLVNWDPKLHTAISDLEVVAEEEKGHLWYFRYPLSDGSGALIVATTRPETMLGDTAVAVHPEDPRYQSLIGKKVKLPLTDREIPIIADTYVDPEFGTGCVKITPAHDFNDFEVGKRHNLEMINLFDQDAVLNENAPAAYQGLDRFEARKKVVEDLKQLGLLERIEDHVLKTPRGDRSGVVIEPWLTEQWYVKTKPLAEPAIQAVESGTIEFVPKNWENTYFAWMRDIQDWCISRQLWWGHRIPAWYDDQGKAYVGRDEAEVREKYKLDGPLRQDEDVLDTWFSSALWTFSTLGWPEQTEELKLFHPTSVLVTGFDIIFFWVARMIMLTLKFTGQVPFKQVYVHGLVRDAEGQKMSKSKGNVLDPLDIIDGTTLEALLQKRTQGMMQPQLAEAITEQTRKHFPNGIAAYGTDALRFTFLSLASTGRDIKFDIARLEGYRNFCNKIWNAARFVLMNTQDCAFQTPPYEQDYSTPDQWIESRFQQTVKAITQAFGQYRFDQAAQALYEFIWDEYCDWYLELSKVTLYDKTLTEEQKYATRYKLLSVLERTLRLAHPMMPFITEEIWQQARSQLQLTEPSVMLAPYPAYDEACLNSRALTEIQWLKAVTVSIRNIRGEMNVSPAKKIKALFRQGEAANLKKSQPGTMVFTNAAVRPQANEMVKKFQPHLKALANLESCGWLESSQTAPVSATAWVDELEILLPMAGLIDQAAELARLGKELQKAEQELTRIETKLQNPAFVDKAPAAVVEKEKSRLEACQSNVVRLKGQIEQLEALE